MWVLDPERSFAGAVLSIVPRYIGEKRLIFLCDGREWHLASLRWAPLFFVRLYGRRIFGDKQKRHYSMTAYCAECVSVCCVFYGGVWGNGAKR